MPRFVAPAVLIDHRPPIIELRERPGGWEGDLVVGVRSQSAVATLVDRRTRCLRLIALPDGHSAGHLRDALFTNLSQLPKRARRSLTWDQGSAMARHHELAPYFTDGVFFARPASPWQRGTNENMSGLVRQYLPKPTNLSLHTAEDLRGLVDVSGMEPRCGVGGASTDSASVSSLMRRGRWTAAGLGGLAGTSVAIAQEVIRYSDDRCSANSAGAGAPKRSSPDRDLGPNALRCRSRSREPSPGVR